MYVPRARRRRSGSLMRLSDLIKGPARIALSGTLYGDRICTLCAILPSLRFFICYNYIIKRYS